MRAVLDPNVLVSAAIAPRGVCGQVLDSAVDQRYSMLEETRHVAEEAAAQPKET